MADRLPVGGAMTVVAVTRAGTLGDPAPRLEPTTASGAALRPLLGLEPGEELSFGARALSAFETDALVSRVTTTALGGTALVGAVLLEACPAVGQSLEMAWTVDELAARSNRLRAQLDADVTARG